MLAEAARSKGAPSMRAVGEHPPVSPEIETNEPAWKEQLEDSVSLRFPPRPPLDGCLTSRSKSRSCAGHALSLGSKKQAWREHR